MVVRATVVDLRGDDSRSTDRLWIDTQVWVVLAYTRAPCPNHLQPYPRYIKQAKAAGASLVAGTIHLAELARCVEHSEQKIYEAQQGLGPGMGIKAFRQIPAARSATVGEIRVAWKVLMGMATLAATAVASTDVESAGAGMAGGELLDPGDALQLAEARRCNVLNVVSDDSDFATVEGITLFTANERVLLAASKAGRTSRR